MTETTLSPYQFTIGASINEWLEQRRTTRSGSEKTTTTNRGTMTKFWRWHLWLCLVWWCS